MDNVTMKKSVIENVKNSVRELSAYTLKDYEYDLKMNQNENPYDVPADIKKEILEYALERSWSRYPTFIPFALHDKLAEYSGWRADGILAGNGSNEIIQALMAIFLGPGDKIVLPSPTFTVYGLVARVLEAEVVNVPLNPDMSFDCDALEEAFLGDEKAKVLVICSPNNPTGTLYPLDRLEALLQKTDRAVVVDEAYYEFSKVSAVDMLERYDNLVVLRTFSKAFSFAAMRFGYGLMSPELATEVGKAKLPYNIDFFSEAAAMKLIDNRDRLQAGIDELIEERDRILPLMNVLDGVKAYPSRANFILFETKRPPAEIFDALLADGILVRNVSSYPMLGKALRVSVSTPSDNDRFLASLKKALG